MTIVYPVTEDAAEARNRAPLLRTKLCASYGVKEVLREVELDLREGEILGLAGQSGCGKSTLALALMGLLKYKGGSAAGTVDLMGQNLLQCTERDLRAIRGKKIALVLQNAASALNPALSVETQLKEAWRAHAGQTWDSAQEWICSVLRGVDLPYDAAFLKRLPRQLSSGQAQRVLIAMALLHRPRLLVADEPTSALDVITQREVIRLLERVNRETGAAILCISHDLPMLGSFCHRVAILRGGGIVECGPPSELFTRPAHPYTQRLVDALEMKRAAYRF